MILCESLDGQPHAVAPERLIFRPSVYALIPHVGKIVLITIRGTGKYGLPGGAVEPHEQLDQALIREVREETGLVVSVERLLHFKETFFYYDPSDSAFHTLSFFFLCHPQTVTLIADDLVEDGDLPEAMSPRWINPYTLRPDEIQGFFTDLIALLPTVLCNLHCSRAPPQRFAVDANLRYDRANEVTRKRRMPSVLRVGQFRFYFFSNERQEPAHIHVKAAEDQAKFWLDPLALAANYGFAARELNEIEQIIVEHQTELLEAWHDYFSQT